MAILCRVIVNNFIDQIQYQIDIKSGISNDSQFIFYLLIQYIPIHRHKVPLDIKFQNIAILPVILRTRADKMRNSFYPFRCSFANSATITVFNKMMLKNRINVIKNEVMHYAVPKVSGKYFSLNGFFYHETNTLSDFILTTYYFFIKNK